MQSDEVKKHWACSWHDGVEAAAAAAEGGGRSQPPAAAGRMQATLLLLLQLLLLLAWSLLVGHAASGVATAPPPARRPACPGGSQPAFQPRLLNFSWDRLPTFWQGAPQELATPQELAAATQFSMVVVTHHHGPVDAAVAACRRVKLSAPSCNCIIYWNVQLVINSSAVGRSMDPVTGSRRGWLLRDDAGELMLPAGKFLTPDYRLRGVGEWFLSGCANATRSGWVDGCNLDGGNECVSHATHR
jgi:hypothetical protein